MRNALSVVALAACVAWVPPVGAQNVPGVDNTLAEGFCTDGPGNERCSEDNLIVAFEGAVAGTENVFEIPEGGFVAGMQVVSLLKMDAVSAGIQGWSIAVAHDEAILSITDADLTLDGTDAGTALVPGSSFATNSQVSGGYISAVVLDFGGKSILPTDGRKSIIKATYTVNVAPGAAGTAVRVVNKEIAPEGSPPVELVVTAEGGKTKSPHWFVQGKIKEGGGGQEDCTLPANALYFGAAAAGTVADDADGTIEISSRNTGEILGFQLGVAISTSNEWTFSDALGNNELIETIFTDAAGDSQTPAKDGNTAQAANAPTAVAKGAALAGFANDFFQAELAPAQGGTGFFVGYVADVVEGAEKIPATANDDSCPVQELLVVTTGEVTGTKFNRGDANGDGLYNVTDGILVVQVQVGNIAAKYPGCPAILDANGDGTNNLSDAVYLLNYVFEKTAPAPPAPFRTCAILAGADCASDSNCQ